jgi:hypothetical protein
MKRICRICRRPSAARVCPTCGPVDPVGWSGRSRQEQHRFRLAVLARDGHRCACRGRADGCDRVHPTPCGAAFDLQAHHVRPGWLVQDGITLCRACHRSVDRYAR